MAHGGTQTPLTSPPPTTTTPRSREPHHGSAHPDSAQSKRDLASWWRNFRGGNSKLEEQRAPQGIFGVPLDQSIRYANVAISLFNDQGQSYIYGYVPIVIAKCGVFLKERATETEGIFRLAGSERRIKELKVAFDSPDRYGKGLDWTGYTVHDAANILRRYLNQLPEPIIPLGFYERFRDPLRNHQQQAVGEIETQKPDQGGFDADKAIRAYQALITELPPLNRQLLLYILDLLAVFASKSDMNKMTTPNLAAIFQPGILSHPQHDMAPSEYRLSQDVLIFLIENQDSFLIGMHGTAADEQTMRDVQSGYQPRSQTGSPTAAPGRSRTVVGRTTSNASGEDGGRRLSSIRRNLSTSSRNSRRSSARDPGSPAVGSPSLGAGGVHRSNTVPSQRPAGSSPRFGAREKSSDPPTPNFALPPAIQQNESGSDSGQKTPVAAAQAAALLQQRPAPPEVTSASSSEATTPLAAPGSDTSSAILIPKSGSLERGGSQHLLAPEVAGRRDTSADRSGSSAPGARNFLDILRKSPGSESEKREHRQTRKLQKKRIPGSSLSSAASSAADLAETEEDDAADSVASPATPQFRDTDPMKDARPEMVTFHTAASHPGSAIAAAAAADANEPLQQPPRNFAEAGLRTHSPNRSVQSVSLSATDNSEADGDFVDEGVAREKREKKRRWRFSHSSKSRHGASESVGDAKVPPVPPLASPLPPGSPAVTGSGEVSRSGSGAMPAPALAQTSSITPTATTTASGKSEGAESQLADRSVGAGAAGASPPEHSSILSDSEERKRGPVSWIKGKIAERKEKEAEKRAKSPTGVGHEKEGRGSVQVDRQGSLPLAKAVDVERSGSVEVGRQVSGARQASAEVGRQGSVDVARQSSGATGAAAAAVRGSLGKTAIPEGGGAAAATNAARVASGGQGSGAAAAAAAAARSASGGQSAVKEEGAAVESAKAT